MKWNEKENKYYYLLYAYVSSEKNLFRECEYTVLLFKYYWIKLILKKKIEKGIQWKSIEMN